MPVVRRTKNVVEFYTTEITQEQYDLYQQSPDEFWDFYYQELEQYEEYFDEKVLEEWIDVEE